MLNVVRARLSPVAAALLVSLLALNLPHAADAEHDHVAVAAFAHNASTHAIGTPQDDGAPPLHCVVCHFARLLRPRADAPTLPVPPTSAGTLVHIQIFTAARPAPVAQPPLRSPPAPSEPALA